MDTECMVAFVAIGLFVFRQGVQAPKEQKSLFEQVVATPTGANGYEEYLRAADALNDPDFVAITDAINQVGNPATEQKPLPDWAQGKTRLELERMRVGKYEPVLRWIHDGNQKNVYDPRTSIDPNTVFPELVAFKKIAKFAASDAKVHFADGDPDGAAKILADELEFAHNIRKCSLIHDLVGIACEAICLAAVEPRMDGFSQLGLDLFTERAKAELQSAPPLAEALTREKSMQIKFVEQFLNPQTGSGYVDEDMLVGDEHGMALLGRFRSLSSEQQQSCLRDAEQQIGSTIDDIAQALQGPERNWPKVIDNPTPTLAQSLASYSTDSDIASCQAELRNRIQVRLLLVHAMIERFRLEMDRLPTSLDELKDPQATTDPLTGKPFLFQVFGPTYRLRSQGNGSTGPIELRYRHEPGDPQPTEPDQP